MSLINKLKMGLKKSREQITQKIDAVLSFGTKVDEEIFEEIEEILIMADVGIRTTSCIIEELRKRVRERRLTEGQQVREELKGILKEILAEDDGEQPHGPKPMALLMVGVNGVGKTTTIGKLAAMYKNRGKKVLMVAGDTFRAAAIEQLEVWARRIGTEIIKNVQGADPAAVIFDGIQAAKAREADILLCDTAGRLHSKKNLMEELKKVQRIINRELPDNPKETLLVLDATTGQNALVQAKLFKEAVDVTGIIITKMDGTAKGGIIFAIKNELGVPVKYIGIGEGVDDLQPFDSNGFVDAIFE